MKINFKKLICVLPALFLLWGCNSTTYDIVEIEEKVDISKTNTQDTSLFSQNNNEIKEDLNIDSKKPENKLDDKQVVSREYAIQIGAFINEGNASSFTEYAKHVIDQSVYYKKYEEMFKVRTGNFNDMQDALNYLQKIRNLGYSDSFLVVLTYFQAQDK